MAAREPAPVALVTGANRGIGLEVCRQLGKLGFTVLLGSRDLGKGRRAAQELVREGLNISPRELDITNQQSIDDLRNSVESEFRVLHVLINNAGILYDTWQSAMEADLKVVREAFETNTFGAWRMCKTFVPLLGASGHGRIVNVSSEAGSLASMGGGAPAYSMSKAAMNALTRMLATELRERGILVNLPPKSLRSRSLEHVLWTSRDGALQPQEALPRSEAFDWRPTGLSHSQA